MDKQKDNSIHTIANNLATKRSRQAAKRLVKNDIQFDGQQQSLHKM